MGEAKRREKLGVPTRLNKKEIDKSNHYFSWLLIIKSKIKKYPYIGVATMALGVFIFLISDGANTLN